MHVSELFDVDSLRQEIEDGYVRVQSHPDLPLKIYCYTKQAMIDQHWNTVTKTCRGLILNTLGTVVARPFRKFFNYGEPAAPHIPVDSPVRLYDKIDGSLGVVYPTVDGKFAVATKGSFTSPQALRATEIWERDYAGRFRPPKDHTILVEIVYPENRIVLDYGRDEKLILLGMVGNLDGVSYSPESVIWWPGDKAEYLGDNVETDGLLTRDNVEGLVAFYPNEDERLKFKQADYLEKHKAVFNLSERSVWNAWVEGRYVQFVRELPEEFQDWARSVGERFACEASTCFNLIFDSWEAWLDVPTEDSSDRKAFAAWAKSLAGNYDSWWLGAMFAEFDNNWELRNSIIQKWLMPNKVKVNNG